MTVEENLCVLEQDLAGKNAVVTGASRGIGRAIALHLAMRGARVIGTCSSADSLHHLETLEQSVTRTFTAAGLQPPSIFGIAADVTSEETPELIARTVVERFDSKLDILVNNAAYYEFRPMGQLDAAHVNRILSGNITALVILMDTLYRQNMFQPDSRVVNVSSDTAKMTNLPFPGMLIFSATKCAMESLTRAWADTLGHNESSLGTTVNSLSVGATATDAMKNSPPALQDIAEKVIRNNKAELGIMGRAEDIANVAGLLISKRAGWVTGSVIAASGGATKIL
ncbi:hypothetical protein V2G26_018352 [Clonostachys chloroleuca]